MKTKKVKQQGWIKKYLTDLEKLKKGYVGSYMNLSSNQRYNPITQTEKGIILGVNLAIDELKKYVDFDLEKN